MRRFNVYVSECFELCWIVVLMLFCMFFKIWGFGICVFDGREVGRGDLKMVTFCVAMIKVFIEVFVAIFVFDVMYLKWILYFFIMCVWWGSYCCCKLLCMKFLFNLCWWVMMIKLTLEIFLCVVLFVMELWL